MISISNPEISLAVVGSSSMIGSRFCELAEGDFDLVKSDLNQGIPSDITDKSSVDSFFRAGDFSHLILFSAFTDVDASEKERGNKNGIVWKINVGGTQNIVEASEKYKKKLIFISTDFVFDGTRGPYSEDDQTSNPDKVSWYGVTKIEGENLVKKIPGAVILRTS